MTAGGATVRIRDRLTVAAGNLVLPIAVAAFAVAFLIGIQSLPEHAVRYPTLIASGALVLCAVIIITELRRQLTARPESVRVLTWTTLTAALRSWHKTIGTMVLVAGVVYALPHAGFYPTTAGFLLILYLYLGVRRPIVLAALVLSILAAAYVVFGVLLSVQLPDGRWW